MQIDEIGANQPNNDISGQRQAKEMARRLATEQLASQQASAGAQAPSTQSDLNSDVTQLSDQAVGQLAQASPGAPNRRDRLRDSLLEKLNQEIINPYSEFNKQKKSQKTQSGGEKKKVKRKREWEPVVRPGTQSVGF